tara:strand:- start:639 stop:752 length:114 start_codon:yes stop_codon:yes gene_type:complete
LENEWAQNANLALNASAFREEVSSFPNFRSFVEDEAF